MPPLEVNYSWFVGLAITLACWLATAILIKLALGWSQGRAERYDNREAMDGIRHTREWIRSLLAPSLFIILVVWVLAFVSLGGIKQVQDHEDKAGELKPTVEAGKLFQGKNNPATRAEELREEGDELIDQRVDELDDFRQDFLNKKGEKDETAN